MSNFIITLSTNQVQFQLRCFHDVIEVFFINSWSWFQLHGNFKNSLHSPDFICRLESLIFFSHLLSHQFSNPECYIYIFVQISGYRITVAFFLYTGDRPEPASDNSVEAGLWSHRGLSDVETNEVDDVDKKTSKQVVAVTEVPKQTTIPAKM